MRAMHTIHVSKRNFDLTTQYAVKALFVLWLGEGTDKNG